jgi:hypothetical protein
MVTNVEDITYIPTEEGWHYFAEVEDLFQKSWLAVQWTAP